MADQVTIQLAHPLTAAQVARLRATDPGDRNVGDSITVPRDEALAVINSGYARGIDPSDTDAVRTALRGGGEASADAMATPATLPDAPAAPDTAAASGRAKKTTDGGR